MDITAAGICFMQFAGQLAVATKDYIASVKNYPKTLDKLVEELNMIQKNLTTLISMVNNSAPDAELALKTFNSLVKSCQKEADEVLEKLKRGTNQSGQKGGIWKMKRVWIHRLLWPLTEMDIENYLRMVQRYTSQLALAINIDTK